MHDHEVSKDPGVFSHYNFFVTVQLIVRRQKYGRSLELHDDEKQIYHYIGVGCFFQFVEYTSIAILTRDKTFKSIAAGPVDPERNKQVDNRDIKDRVP